MEIIPLINLKAPSLPLPIYENIKIADYTSKDGEEFSIFVGLDKNLVNQLKKYSLDESDQELQKNTGDMKRFGTGSYEDWYKKTRTPFALVHTSTNALAALVWFGPEPLHEGCKCHTAGWRSYKPFRGTGIMKDFTKFAFDFYAENFPNTKFWIAAKKENTGSIYLANYLGFMEDKERSDNDSIIMTKGA